jgi:multiple antibiotic resistance protein
LILSALTGILLLAAAPIEHGLGQQGLMVLTRIFGLLLLSIAVSTVMSSLTFYIHSL